MFLPLFSFSPEEIFKGNILLFDIDFFNPETQLKALTEVTDDDGNVLETHTYDLTENENFEQSLQENENIKYFYFLEDESLPDTEENRIITSKQNTALDLQPLVSQWYSAIRNIAIVLSMSVLLYVGIRMLLSSIAQDKAKYKQMLIDWVVGLCLLFFMHYIMAFSVTLVQAFNNVIASAGEETDMGHIVLLENDEDSYIKDKLEDIGMGDLVDDSTDPAYIMWPTNLMGMLRLKAQVSYGDTAFVGYGICYFILVLLTIYFVFVYLKRVLYMAFLTMIAPLVALTYPIDKVNDGQAQGFNSWLKEYVFNLLLQPLHLLLYTILVTSAYDLASENVIYSLVAIGFLIPAEKLMRGLFGFEKAKTAGSMAGAAAGAALMNSGLQKLLHKGPSGKSGGGKKDSDGDDEGISPPISGYYDPMDGMAEEDKDEKQNQKDMLDAYDDKHGTDEWDPAERDQMAREAYKDDPGMQYSDEEYRNILKDSGYSDEEIDQMMVENRNNNNNGDNREAELDGYSLFGLANNKLSKSKVGAPARVITGAVGSAGKFVKGKYGTAKNWAGNKATQLKDNGVGQKLGKAKDFVSNSKEGEMLKGAGRVMKYTAKQGIRNLGRTASKALKATPKVAAGAVLGAVAGTAGASLAIATGDPSNLLTYGGGAALAGAYLGSSAINTNTQKSAGQIAREKAFYGEKYDAHLEAEFKKKWKTDSKKKEELEGQLGEKKVKELYKTGKIDRYIENGATNTKDIIALEQLQEKAKISFDEAMVSFDAHGKYGDITKQKPKDQVDIEAGYTKEFMNRGNSEEKAKGNARRITKNTHMFEDFRKKL